MSDLLDRASELEQQQRDQALKAALTKPKEAQDIDADGNHYCVDCGEQISAQRLIALPHAVCCIDCQSIREHERKKLCSKI
jgi:DnaK suppressor protein